jgi:hypothetical protein
MDTRKFNKIRLKLEILIIKLFAEKAQLVLFLVRIVEK